MTPAQVAIILVGDWMNDTTQRPERPDLESRIALAIEQAISQEREALQAIFKHNCLHCDWDKKEDYVDGKGHRHGDKFYPCEDEQIRRLTLNALTPPPTTKEI